MCKKLVLYGSGNIGIKWLERLGAEKIYAFLDSDCQKIGGKVQGKEVLAIDELSKIKENAAIYIATSYKYKKEIYHLLRSKHLEKQVVGYPALEENVYLNWDSYTDVDTVFEGRNALAVGAQLYGCSIGFASYVSSNTVLRNAQVGRYTSIGPNVRVVVGQHPTGKFVSTHPMFYSTQQIIKKSYVMKNSFEEFRYTNNGYTAEIGNDVWIGDGVTIMEGISIADGTIVAAGANVVRDTVPYSIVGGNPARVIRYRFAEEDIKFLLDLKWWSKGEAWVDMHAQYFDDIKKLRKYC